MTLKSSWSIASDDENSRQSFLSDCDSEFDLTPPPRYPTENYSPSILSKLSINQNEPPMTRARTKATSRTMIIPQSLPKERRQSTLRCNFDSFTGMAAALKNSLNNNSIVFPKQEPSNDILEITKVVHSPMDGVNTLTDWFESCSIDEGKFSKSCVWPSRETNSHYMRSITSVSPNVTFGSNPFSKLQTSPVFVQSSSTTTKTLFGQQQAQLWSRFRFAASAIRDNFWIERLDSTASYHQSNIFTSSNNNNTHPFHFSDPSSSPPQIVPSIQIKTPSSPIHESLSPLLRQRPMTPVINSEPSISFIPTKKEDVMNQQSSSKIFFTLTIFAVGLVLGYFLTNTFPPGLIRHCYFIIWETCVKLSIQYFHLLCVYLQTVIKYFSSFLLT